MTYTVVLVPEPEGGYSVMVPGLPGCHTQGETREEALENARDSIRLWLDVAEEIGDEAEYERAQIHLA